MAKKPTRDPETDDLKKYFTDVEYLRDLFAKFVAAEELPRRILAIHGVGGVGKSSLMRMCRLHAKNVHAPIALTSAEESKSTVDVLSNWSSDLKADGISLSNFQKTLVHYKAVQAKVEDVAKKAQEARKKSAEKIGTAVAKAVIGVAINLIPGMPIVTALGGVGIDALVDWLSGYLTKPDIDLLLDPTKALSKDFLEDIAKVARKRRLVLLLDTFEQMSALNDWVCDTAKQLDENILLVITGREMINWDRRWDGWLAHTQVEELHPMTEDNMRELARRYYATMVGDEPDPKQIEAIIAFARGLPMALATAVRLWVKYGQKFDIEEHKAEVYGDVVKRLREGVSSELLPVLEAAAIVRWFDRPILRAVTKLKDVSAAYDELRRFPFVKSRKEGLSLHDSVREIMDETLRVDDPDRHKDLHKLAVKYFDKQMMKTTDNDVERLELERLYHQVCVDEKAGIKLFQNMAEELTQYRMVNKLRVLLNDVSVYSLEYENSRLWREYYRARLAQLDANGTLAEQGYETVSSQSKAEFRLHSYALCDLGYLRSRWQHLGKPGGIVNATHILEESLASIQLDHHLVNSHLSLAHVYQYQGAWEKSLLSLEKAKQFYLSQQDTYGIVLSFAEFMTMYWHIGDIKKIFEVERDSQQVTSKLPEQSYARAQLFSFACTRLLAGRYGESENFARQSLDTMQYLGETRGCLEPMRWLSWALALQGKFTEAVSYCQKHLEITEKMGNYYIKDAGHGHEIYGAVLILQGRYDEAEKHLLQSLKIKENVQETLWLSVTLARLGILHELRGDWEIALNYFQKSLSASQIKQKYFEANALIGLCRIINYLDGFALGQQAQLYVEAEQLAQRYEYNDHIASLRLTQGHIAWEQQPAKVLKYYQHALIYALRYNRFLLDEVLSGRPQGTPLRPIIPFCLERGEEGRKILIALQKRWKTGTNDIGKPRLDTISPIPENIPLLEAEKLARERELGEGTTQKTVLEQLETAIKNSNKLGS